MKWFVIRNRINKLLKKLDTFWKSHSSIDSLSLSDQELETLMIMEQMNLIECKRAMGGAIYDIKRGSQSQIYSLERSELWFNRIAGFIAGLLSGLTIQFIWSIIAGIINIQ
ncbi:hypothetical protein [Pseudobutyrivibrio sp.]